MNKGRRGWERVEIPCTGVRRTREGSRRKAQTRRKEIGMAGRNGKRKVWGKECGNRMSRELERASGLGQRSNCRVWLL